MEIINIYNKVVAQKATLENKRKELNELLAENPEALEEAMKKFAEQLFDQEINLFEEVFGDSSSLDVNFEEAKILRNGLKVSGLFLLTGVGIVVGNDVPTYASFAYINNGKTTMLNSIRFDELASKRICATLMRRGIMVLDSAKAALAQYLQSLVLNFSSISKYIDVKYIYEKIGFNAECDEKLETFYHLRPINSSNIIDGKLIGNACENLKQAGEFEDYMRMLSKEACCAPMQLALVLGCAGAVVGKIKGYNSVNNVLVNLVGQSSTGKTTAGELAISVFTQPIMKREGFYVSSNSTLIKLMRSLQPGRGFTYFIDDISAFGSAKSKTSQKLIYEMEAGLSRSAVGKDVNEINGVILFTSERTMVSENYKEGALVRINEFDLDHWTSSAENSNNIKRAIKETYGVFGPRFVEYLLSNFSTDELKKSVARSREDLAESITKNDEFTSRALDGLSVIYATAIIVDMFVRSLEIGYELDLSGIVEILVASANNMFGIRNNFIDTYHNVCEFIIRNEKKFIATANGIDKSISDFYGAFKDEHGQRIACVNNKCLNAMLGEEELIISERTYAIWCKKGYAIPHDNNVTFKDKWRIDMNNQQFRCLKIVLGIDTSKDEEELNGLPLDREDETLLTNLESSDLNIDE